MTGHFCGVIHIMEERSGKPLQWSICQLDCNELPWRRVFRLLDGVNWSWQSLSGKIGKMIGGVVSNWDVKDFQAMSANLFLCLVMKLFVMLVMTNITHKKFVGQSFAEL